MIENRIGIGSDTHRLTNEGTGFRIGGVFVPSSFEVIAHSDGDALLHSLTDAILGALGTSDIGDLFPDTAAENKGRASEDFLTEAVRLMNESNYTIANCDTTISLERPQLGDFKGKIREEVARIIGCSVEQISVKAKRGEGLGAVGQSRAISCEAIVLLTRK